MTCKSLNQIKAEAIGEAMERIDMNNFKMAGNIDPVVLRYMGELARYADSLMKKEEADKDDAL